MKAMQKMVNGSKIICSYPLMDGHPIDVQSTNPVSLILQHRTEGLQRCPVLDSVALVDNFQL